MAYTKYSLTPANNNATPPDGAPEGMLPSAVNDTMRDMMAQIRDCGDGIRDGTYTMTAPKITGGTITGAAFTGNTFTSPVISGGTINNAVIGGSTAAAGTFTSLSDSGNLTFTGTGNRITGDFSNATASNRVAFQSSTTNGNTVLQAIPNGTATQTNFVFYSDSAQTNFAALNILQNTSETSFRSIQAGSGSYVPVTFWTGGSERLRIDTSGNVGIGLSTVPDALTLYNASAARFSVYGDGQTQINARRYSTDASAPTINLGKYRGTYASPSAVSTGDGLTQINWQAYGGTNLRTVAQIAGFVEAYTSDTDIAANLRFYTSPSGSASVTERMRIDSNGNVGIGVSSPANYAGYKSLAIGSTTGGVFDITENGTRRFSIYGNSSGGILETLGAYPLAFQTNSTERMRIDSSGNVGIGTAAPEFKLSIAYGDVTGPAMVISGGRVANGAPEILFKNSYWNGGNFGAASIAGADNGSAGGNLIFKTTTSGSGTGGVPSERMRIDNSGNVGIGTSSPGRTLEVKNSTIYQIRTGDGGTYYDFGRNNSTGYFNFYGSQTGYVGYIFSGVDGERMRIDSSGNVGIGTSSPSQKLHVQGNSLVIPSAGWSSGQTANMYIGDTGNGWSSTFGSLNTLAGYYGFAFTTNGTERMRITSSGNVGIGTSSPAYTLDVEGTVRIGTGGSIQPILSRNGSTGGLTINTTAASAGGSLIVQDNGTERLRVNGDNLQFNSGYGSVATAYGCRAWVNFNGTGTVAIRGSGNVSSITDNGTGSYTVNFTTAMPDVNYAVSGTADRTQGTRQCVLLVGNGTGAMATGSCGVQTLNDGTTLFDAAYVGVVITR